MGISRSPAELEKKLVAAAKVLGDIPKTQVEDASLIVKRSVLALAPSRLRGVGKRGAKLDARYNILGRGEESKSLVFAVGPWQLIEADTSAHRIPRERGARGRRRYAVFGGNVYSRVNHPGTKGKHPWQKGVEAARPAVSKIFESQTDVVLRRIF